MEKKKIIFSVPIYLKQSIKIRDGEKRTYLKWDIFERFYRFVSSLLPRMLTKEVGAEYETVREGYFGLGNDGQLERKELPVINEETEELVKHVCLSLEINNNKINTNNTVMSLEMNQK